MSISTLYERYTLLLVQAILMMRTLTVGIAEPGFGTGCWAKTLALLFHLGMVYFPFGPLDIDNDR